MIRTIRGLMEESDLDRTVGFEDRPKEFVVWVEWRAKDNSELVRRDAHVILKEPTLTADALAGEL